MRCQSVLNRLAGSRHSVKLKNLKVQVLETLNTPVREGYSFGDASLLAQRLDCLAGVEN